SSCALRTRSSPKGLHPGRPGANRHPPPQGGQAGVTAWGQSRVTLTPAPRADVTEQCASGVRSFGRPLRSLAVRQEYAAPSNLGLSAVQPCLFLSGTPRSTARPSEESHGVVQPDRRTDECV